jgi:FkbM family methyltransferase
MNERLQYEIRGWAYWAKCLNPLRKTISINNLPLNLRLRAYKRDAVGRGLYRRKIHEPSLTRLLLTRFADSQPRNFIDVGANIGYFTCLMGKLAGTTGTVVAVEPEPQNFSLLRENTALNQLNNVSAHQCALGASEGTALLGLYKAANRGRHSIVDTEAKSRIEVPVKSLDELTRNVRPNITSWALMKIDVEGYEAFVLDGASETLSRVASMVMEYSPALLRAAGRDPATTLKMLTSHFSSISRIGPEGIVRVTAEDCLRDERQVELIFDR